MTDRDQDRRSSSDDAFGRDVPRTDPDVDPLLELGRLIGQTDPFANFGRANPSHPTRRTPLPEPAPNTYTPADNADDAPPSSGPSWMKHRPLQNRPPVPVSAPVERPDIDDEPDINSTPHPLHRYAAQQPDHHLPDHASPSFVFDTDLYHDERYHQEPSALHKPPHQDDRYDEALYGSVEPMPEPDHAEQNGFTPGYATDGYDDPDAYTEPQKPRRKGFVTVAAVMALAVVGTGGAFAYRNYVGATRSGEPPVIKADTAPIKVVPPTNSSDVSGKLIQDRLASGNGMEKLVSREETPVDPRDPSKAGPRVIFPPLNANGVPATTASNSAAKPLTSSQSAPGDEPRKIRTFAVKGDQNDLAVAPVAKPTSRPLNTASVTPKPPANANGNAPVVLTPQSTSATDARARVASTTPSQSPPAASGGYVVQVASQRNESDALASFKALQGKYPSVLGSRSPQIKRADLGEKGTYYRAVIGPFSSSEDATTVCGNLKTAGGQCVVQRN